MLPVVVHVSVAAASAFGSGVAHKAPQIARQQGSGAGQTVGVCLLAPPVAEPAPELLGELEDTQGC